VRRRGDHVSGICAAGREDMLVQWGPPYAVVEKIDQEKGNLRLTVNSTQHRVQLLGCHISTPSEFLLSHEIWTIG